MQIQIKTLRENAKLPGSQTAGAAGVDLHACLEQAVGIQPGETVVIPTGIAVAIPEGYFGGVYPRSGLATKLGLRLANCVGVIDADYRGEILAPLHNDGSDPVIIHDGDRVAQLLIQPVLTDYVWQEVAELPETQRDEGGFGSTGRN